MGCVQAKPSSNSSRRSLEKFKSDHGYVGGDSNGVRPRSRAVVAETVPETEKSPESFLPPPSSPPPLRQIGAGDDELVDGWPRWLLNNIPKGVLAGLVPKSADSYVKIDKIGQGTYSNVYKAQDRDSGKIVALKKVRFDTAEPESVKFMAREIMIMQKLDHPNVLKLEGIATSRMHYSIYLVFNFMQSDLSRVITRPGEKLTERQIKCYMHQLLSGLRHCHERGILHRDIKGSNLLVDKDGVLKIGDFGLANDFIPKPKRPLTNRVVTLWYRAPELLLGSTDYGVGIDLWSAGCLLAEMFFGRPIMPGRTEVEQIHRIFKLCGSPSGDYWRKLKLSSSFRPSQPYKSTMMEVFKCLPTTSQNLVAILLALDPCNRGTAASALQNEFFITEPLPCDLSGLPVLQNKEEDATDMEQKKHTSFGPVKNHSEGIHNPRRQDQATSNSRIEKPDLSVMKPIENHTDLLMTSSPSSTKPNSSPVEQPKNAVQHHGFEKRSISTSGVSRYSEDLMPDYFAPLDDGNINAKQTNHLFGLQKRSNSTSEFITFSAEWRPKCTTVE